MSTSNPILIAEELLLALKLDLPYQNMVDVLAGINPEDFENTMVNDDTKKAFWINVYNAYFLILRKHKNVKKPAIYKQKSIEIAKQKMSLDDIEHGILRRYRMKISLGYLPDIFAPSWIKNWAVERLDYRIHFALNCGAVSCPPIAFYKVDKIDQQLTWATRSFVESETKVNDDNKTIFTSKIFQWYSADFGGTTGINRILSAQFDQKLEDYQLHFTDYDYTEDLDNFTA